MQARVIDFSNSGGRERQVPRLSVVSDALDPMIGSLVGHIRVTGILGSGGMGEVYRGVDERLNRPVALKVIRADRRLSTEARGRFLREARTLSSLDHPNICRIHEYIEAEDGDFLVLELVEGTTLERAIEVGMSRARKLRVASEIADALAAAHRKGVVHRDLKPENVMIANDGTVKVLDFGIARHHADEEQTPPPAVPQGIEEAETLIFAVGGGPLTPSDDFPVPVTAHGIAVGTPGSMSPEQAVGKTATPASDMYSFGLLLQQLFTERDPHPLDLTASQLMMRAAAGISEPMAGQPRDITLLVDRLKSLAAADRPTAIETLAILKRIVDTPRRRVRMAALAIVLVLVITSAVKYVADITEARRDAERRRQQAEDLVSFMVGDLRTKLEAVGRLDVLDGAASRALDYFASLSPEELGGDDLHKNALALAQLGEVRMNEGKLDAAVKLFRESLRFASAAVARDPKREEWQLALSNAHFWTGEALRQKGDQAGTLQHFRSYLDISQKLAAAHPGDTKYQAEVSYGHGNIGAVYEGAGELDRALEEYRIAVDLDRERWRREPDHTQWQGDLAISLNRFGVASQVTGDLAGARRVFDEELTLRRRLVASAPDDARHITRLAGALGYRGVLQQMMGDYHGAIASFEEELSYSKKLAELDPSNVTVRRNRAMAASRLGTLLTGDRARARQLANEAVGELRAIVATDPRPAWRRDLAGVLTTQARVRLSSGDAAGARAAAREAVALMDAVLATDPHNPHRRRAFCDMLLVAADTEAGNGDAAAALAQRTRAVELAAEGRDPQLLALRVRALAALGRTSEAAPLAARLLAAGYRDGNIAALVKAPPGTAHPPPLRPAL
jgi:tetratricopeptide (TPR) repeat protein